MTPEDVRSFVDEVAGTMVTTFAVCANPTQNVAHPTRVGDMLGDVLDRRVGIDQVAAGLRQRQAEQALGTAIPEFAVVHTVACAAANDILAGTDIDV